MKLKTVLITFGSCLLAANLYAQDVNNPTGATWQPSPDHATIDGYELDLLRPDSTVLNTLSFTGTSKPTVVNNLCTVAINVMPVPFGTGYWARARAKAGTAVSDWTYSVNHFNRIPGKPGTTNLIAQLNEAASDLGFILYIKERIEKRERLM